MFFLIYVSSAIEQFSRDELLSLLEKCRENNTQLEITGMLLYKDGNFMQVLEGKEPAVRRLFSKIAADPRHYGEIILLQGALTERQFPDWSMGFHNLNSSDAIEVPGYSEFLNTKLTGEEFSANPTRAQKLLLTFKRGMQ